MEAAEEARFILAASTVGVNIRYNQTPVSFANGHVIIEHPSKLQSARPAAALSSFGDLICHLPKALEGRID